METIWGILIESFKLTKAMAFYLLLGFLFAGIIKLLFPAEKVIHHLGRGKFLSSLKASLVGIPLPICSCGVLPAAISLKKQGANKGATLSFLISTPVTGIDSILATYALLGSIFTGFRVLTSFVIAVACGTVINFLFKEKSNIINHKISSCAMCAKETLHSHSVVEKIKFVLQYAFNELLDDIAKWLLVGILIGGIISYLMPEHFVTRYLGNSWISMVLMLLVGIPIYVCATGSIPIAAALMLKGMNPGAALVFLITGPATNTVSMTVIAKELGKDILLVYLLFISTISILSGVLLDKVLNGDYVFVQIQSADLIPEFVKIASTYILIMLLGLSIIKNFYRKSLFKSNYDHCSKK